MDRGESSCCGRSNSSAVLTAVIPSASTVEPIGDLKTGTFVFRDRPGGRHELSVNEWDFPGVTKQEVNVAPGRTYFFVTNQSERSKAMHGRFLRRAHRMAVTAIATSGSDNPGPCRFRAPR